MLVVERELYDQLFECNRCVCSLLSVQSLSQMGAIIDFSTGVASFRHLRDQSFVQLERETHRHLCLSLLEDILSQTIWTKINCRGSRQLRRFWEISTNQKRKPDVSQHLHTPISSVTRTYVSITEQSQQINY